MPCPSCTVRVLRALLQCKTPAPRGRPNPAAFEKFIFGPDFTRSRPIHTTRSLRQPRRQTRSSVQAGSRVHDIPWAHQEPRSPSELTQRGQDLERSDIVGRATRNKRKRPYGGASGLRRYDVRKPTETKEGAALHVEDFSRRRSARKQPIKEDIPFVTSWSDQNGTGRHMGSEEKAINSTRPSKYVFNNEEGSTAERPSWQIQKQALHEKFGSSGWQPKKRLSPDAIEGIRSLHAQNPETFTTPILAQHFKVSPEAIRRILKSKWRPSEAEDEDRRSRWLKRGEKIWAGKADEGMKPPRKWRQMGIKPLAWRKPGAKSRFPGREKEMPLLASRIL